MLNLATKVAKAYEKMFGERIELSRSQWEDDGGNKYFGLSFWNGSTWVMVGRVEVKMGEFFVRAYYPREFPFSLHADKIESDELHFIPKIMATLVWAWKYIFSLLPLGQVKILRCRVSSDRRKFEIAATIAGCLTVNIDTSLQRGNAGITVSISASGSYPFTVSPQYFMSNLHCFLPSSVAIGQV